MAKITDIVARNIDDLLNLNLAEKKFYTDVRNNEDYYVLVSPNAFEKDFICILAMGFAEFAGVWSYTLLKLSRLEESSMKPYFQSFIKEDWGVISINPHYSDPDPIGTNYYYQFDKLLEEINPEAKLGFIGFSMGGRPILEYLDQKKNILNRIIGLVLIDPEVPKEIKTAKLLKIIKERTFLVAGEGEHALGEGAANSLQISYIKVGGIHGAIPYKVVTRVMEFFKNKMQY